MKRRIFTGSVLAVWIVIVGYYMLPLKKPINYHPYIEGQSILATQQFCTNQCADVVIKKGKIVIPDKLQKLYPNVRTDVANLVGATPFRQKHGALMYSYDFILFGNYIGVDSTVLEGYIPVYNVTEWYPTQYIARFWQLKGPGEILYLGLLYLGLPIILYFALKMKERSPAEEKD